MNFMGTVRVAAASAFVAICATAASAAVVTTDEKLGEALLGDSGESTVRGALAGFLGVSADSLVLSEENNSPSLTLNQESGVDQFVLDVAPDEPGFFVLKFGVGGPVDSSADHFFFKNIGELTKLVFENPQVNNLINWEDWLEEGETRLSHYKSFDGTQPAPIPLPAGLPLLVGGIAAFGVIRKLKRKAA